MSAGFEFHPQKGCCCQHITFIQVVREFRVGGKPDYVDPAYDPQFEASGPGGPSVDHLQGDDDPYYGAEWDAQGGQWKSERVGGKVGRCGETDAKGRTVKGKEPRFARASDRLHQAPGDPRSGSGDVVDTFITCAFCLDTNEVLGCIQWGFKIKDDPNAEIEVLKPQCSLVAPKNLSHNLCGPQGDVGTGQM